MAAIAGCWSGDGDQRVDALDRLAQRFRRLASSSRLIRSTSAWSSAGRPAGSARPEQGERPRCAPRPGRPLVDEPLETADVVDQRIPERACRSGRRGYRPARRSRGTAAAATAPGHCRGGGLHRCRSAFETTRIAGWRDHMLEMPEARRDQSQVVVVHAEPRRDLLDLVDRVAARRRCWRPRPRHRAVWTFFFSLIPWPRPRRASSPEGRPGGRDLTGQLRSIGRSRPRRAVAPAGAENAGFAPMPPNIPPMPVGGPAVRLSERQRRWRRNDVAHSNGSLRTRSTGLLRSVRQIRCGLQVERPGSEGRKAVVPPHRRWSEVAPEAVIQPHAPA